jgi:hypothetical protein
VRIEFGAGNLFFNPIGGNYPTLDTPQQLATLQDVAIDFGATIKDLRGQYQFPDDTAISDRKITWKSGTGRFDIDAYNNLVFGETAITTGGSPIEVNEAGTIPGSSSYTVTVANHTTFVKDLGVLYAATGQKLTRVPSGVAEGEYSVSAGVYTFYSGDASLGVLISYTYTVATGRILTVNNHVQGYGPSLEMFLSNPYQPGFGQGGVATIPEYVHLYACKVSKLGTPYKRADYLISDIEGEAYANAAGQVADFYED